jgi:hypothetical protein
VIGGWAPSEYMLRLSNSADVPVDVIEKNIRTHFPDPDFLTKDDFVGFMTRRRKSLLSIIGGAMGKTLVDPAQRGSTEEIEEDSSSVEDLLDHEDPVETQHA